MVPPAARIFSAAFSEKRVSAHGQCHCDLAAAQDLDGRAGVLDDALGDERLGSDFGSGLEGVGQPADVDRHAVRAKRPDRHALLGVGPAQLAEPHVERHLAALVAGPYAAAGPGVEALVATAGGLALAAALAAPEPLGVLRRAGVGLEIRSDRDRSCSTHDFFVAGRTSRRYDTLRIMPRITGLSSWTTV